MKNAEFVTIVVPFFNSENKLMALTEKIAAVMEKTSYNYELLLVDDGSTDNSWLVATKIADVLDNASVIGRKTNNNQPIDIATMAQKSRGKYIISVNTNSFQNPMFIPELIDQLKAGHHTAGGTKFIPKAWQKERTCVLSNSILLPKFAHAL